MLNEDTKSKIKNLAKKFDLDFLVLFGSRANNTYNKNSDWDFAIYRKKPFETSEILEINFELIDIVDDEKIDLLIVDLIKTPPYLIYNILTKGVPIYVKNQKKFRIMQENIFFDYIDTRDMFKELKEEYLKN